MGVWGIFTNFHESLSHENSQYIARACYRLIYHTFFWKRCFFSLLQCIYFHAFCLPQGYQLTLRFMFSYHIFFNVLCSLLLSNVFSQSLYSCCKLKVMLILNNHTCSLMKMFCYTEPWWPAKHILTYLATLPTW